MLAANEISLDGDKRLLRNAAVKLQREGRFTCQIGLLAV
jgi:hypothetical protein